MMTNKVSRGQTVTLYETSVLMGTMRTVCDQVWLLRTPAEVQALRDADKAAGRWHDDGGEPILYGRYSGYPEGIDRLTVIVTSRRPEWMGTSRRPKGLRSGFCAELGREVLFQSA